MSEQKLTHFQLSALMWLAQKHAAYPANDYGFLPTSRAREAAVCRRVLEPLGLVSINRMAENGFRYSLTPAGHEAFDAAFSHPQPEA